MDIIEYWSEDVFLYIKHSKHRLLENLMPRYCYIRSAINNNIQDNSNIKLYYVRQTLGAIIHHLNIHII